MTDVQQPPILSIPGAARVKIAGVGGAGCAMAEALLGTDLSALPVAAVHTNARVLRQHSVPQQLLIGASRGRGLGVAGDCEAGRAMAESESPKLAGLAADCDLMFILAGLGGGTGTGVAPVLAQAAREQGALVIAIAATPFDFEPDRRHKQAQFGLQTLRSAADAVICLPNQKLCRCLDESPTIVEAFARANALLGQGIRGLREMLLRPGVINVDFAYLCSVLRGRHTESLLAAAEASGPDRAQAAVGQLLAHPMLGSGSLAEADQVLVSLLGAQNLPIGEITAMMDRLKRATPAELVFGTAVDPSSNERIRVTLVASKYGKPPAQPVLDAAAQSARQLTSAVSSSDDSLLDEAAGRRPAPRFIAPPPENTPEKARELLEKHPSSRLRRGAAKWKQELLALEIVSRGRFEKSEPTIHRGADLDVPAYIRRGTPLN